MQTIRTQCSKVHNVHVTRTQYYKVNKMQTKCDSCYMDNF